jgi:hypothetical protein
MLIMLFPLFFLFPRPSSSCIWTPITFHQQAVEAYGIFCLGEIIGRRNLVGYKLKE